MPTTPNIAEWERLRARFMCEEMSPTAANPRGLTPAEAATNANARTINAFRVLFPGRAMPMEFGTPTQSKSLEPLPGGVTTSDGRTWMIAARTEDDRSSFPKNDRISAQELADTAESYDPDLILRAPVIAPENGPGHWTGEYAKQTLGQVDAVSFDGHNLWTLISQNSNGVTKAIKAGLIHRSVGLMPNYSEAGDKPYLRHLLITAETPGITNLRPLDEFFPEGADPNASRAFSETPTRWRTFNDLPEAERTTTMTTKNQTEVETVDLEALVARTATAAAEAAVTAFRATPPANVEVVAGNSDSDAKTRSLIAEALKPYLDANTKLTGEVETLRAAQAAGVEAGKTRAREAVIATYRTAVDAAFEANKIDAQERTTLDAVVANPETPEAVITALSESFVKRTAKPKARKLEPVVNEEGKQITVDSDLAQAIERGAPQDEVALVVQMRAKYPGDTPEARAQRSAAILAADRAARHEINA